MPGRHLKEADYCSGNHLINRVLVSRAMVPPYSSRFGNLTVACVDLNDHLALEGFQLGCQLLERLVGDAPSVDREESGLVRFEWIQHRGWGEDGPGPQARDIIQYMHRRICVPPEFVKS